MSDLSAKNDDARAAPSPTVCPNCGNVRPSPFCPECGQNDRNYARGLGTVVWEFGREAFEMDSRFLQTLKLLLFKPGSLTNEFSRNRRARYMSPIRLYLFTSFLFVLVLSFAMPDSWSEGAAMMGSDSEEVPEEFVVPVGGLRESLPVDGQVRDGDSRESPPVVGEATDDDADESPQLAGQTPRRNLDVDIDTQVSEDQIEALRVALGPTHGRKLDDILGRPDENAFKAVALLIAGFMSSEEEDRTVSRPAGEEDPGRNNFFIRMLLTSTIDFLHDPEVFVQRAVGNLPIAMFFLLPFLALALGFCYVRKKRFFVEHLVFGMHNQTFTFLCLAAAQLTPGGSVGGWFRVFFLVIPQVYYLIALRRYYRDGWIRTILKGSIVWWLYMMVLLPGFLFVLFLTA